jgi:hypothetical protein
MIAAPMTGGMLDKIPAVLAIPDPCGFEALLRLGNDVDFGQGNLFGLTKQIACGGLRKRKLPNRH